MAGVVCVLDLSLCKSSLAVGTPVNRLQSLVDVALLVHLAEDLHLSCLKLGLKGKVGVVKIALNAKTLELIHLVLYLCVSILSAVLSQLGSRNSTVFNAHLLKNLKFNGETMGIPAGNIRRAVAAHIFLLYNNVLEHLVECCSKVNVAIGIRRSVVKNIAGLALVLLDHLVVHSAVIRILDHAGLFLREVSSHGKVGLRKIKSGIVILCHFPNSP